MGRTLSLVTSETTTNMNPLMIIPLMAMSCAAVPGVVYHGAALPLAHAGVVATHSVTHNVPSAVEYKQVGDTVAVGHPLVHAAVPGYTVGGEIRTVSDVDTLPLVSTAGVYAHPGLLHTPLAVVKAEDAEEADKTVAIHTIPTAYTTGHVLGAPVVPHLGLGLGYHGLGLGYAGLPIVAAEAAEEPAAEVAEE